MHLFPKYPSSHCRNCTSKYLPSSRHSTPHPFKGSFLKAPFWEKGLKNSLKKPGAGGKFFQFRRRCANMHLTCIVRSKKPLIIFSPFFSWEKRSADLRSKNDVPVKKVWSLPVSGILTLKRERRNSQLAREKNTFLRSETKPYFSQSHPPPPQPRVS